MAPIHGKTCGMSLRDTRHILARVRDCNRLYLAPYTKETDFASCTRYSRVMSTKKLIRVVCVCAGILAACGTEEQDEQEDAFVVRGVSGEEIVLDRIWDRGCIPGANGIDWIDAHRTLTGFELVTEMVDYQNGSQTPNCTDGRVGSSAFTLTITSDDIQVPVSWVDFEGAPSEPPPGLEGVTQANGATGLMTEASVTPETQERADQLNSVEFCGYTDWAPDVAKDTVDCFTGGFNPSKGTIVVDDRTMPWKIYDGVGLLLDEQGYPTDMPNYLPHEGPFDTLER